MEDLFVAFHDFVFVKSFYFSHEKISCNQINGFNKWAQTLKLWSIKFNRVNTHFGTM